jgi:hypothetical protein
MKMNAPKLYYFSCLFFSYIRLHYPKDKIMFPEYDFLEAYKTVIETMDGSKRKYPAIHDTFRFTRVKRLIYSPHLEDIMKFGAAAGLVDPVEGNFQKCKITVMREGAQGIIHYFGPNKQLEETIQKACEKMKDANEFLLPQRLREMRNAGKITPPKQLETIY